MKQLLIHSKRYRKNLKGRDTYLANDVDICSFAYQELHYC